MEGEYPVEEEGEEVYDENGEGAVMNEEEMQGEEIVEEDPQVLNNVNQSRQPKKINIGKPVQNRPRTAPETQSNTLPELKFERKQIPRDENVLVTYIYYTRVKPDYHYIENVHKDYSKHKLLDLNKLRKSGALKGKGFVKTESRCSCQNVQPSEPKEKIQKSEIFVHYGKEGTKDIDTSNFVPKNNEKLRGQRQVNTSKTVTSRGQPTQQKTNQQTRTQTQGRTVTTTQTRTVTTTQSKPGNAYQRTVNTIKSGVARNMKK